MRSITEYGRGRCKQKKRSDRFLEMEQLRFVEKWELGRIAKKFNVSYQRVSQILIKSSLHIDRKKYAYENSAYVYDRRKRIVGRKITNGEWDALKEIYNYTCLRCGRKEPESS